MRQSMVAGNWKMNGNHATSTKLTEAVLEGANSLTGVEVVLCPPSIFIPLVSDILAGSRIIWGGQNVDSHSSGAYTGEISAPMLFDYGCTYCIVGHSERRAFFGETDQVVAAKFGAIQEHDLIPILCVGETLEEREQGKTEEVVARQLDAVIEAHGVSSLIHAVLAYEPVWAIGTGKTASPEQAQEVHQFIRQKISSLDKGVSKNLRILYGGSVKADNAQALFSQTDIDGGLIGGASLKAEDFVSICRAAN